MLAVATVLSVVFHYFLSDEIVMGVSLSVCLCCFVYPGVLAKKNMPRIT